MYFVFKTWNQDYVEYGKTGSEDKVNEMQQL